MEYSRMSLADLKKVARDHRPRIKKYYVMSKTELLSILTTPEFPETLKVEKMKLVELRAEAKKRNIPGTWKLRRAELFELLYASPHKNDKNDDHAQKHNDP